MIVSLFSSWDFSYWLCYLSIPVTYLYDVLRELVNINLVGISRKGFREVCVYVWKVRHCVSTLTSESR